LLDVLKKNRRKRQVAAPDWRIDRVVDPLYELTEEEIAFGEGKPG
jgi:hypothetical protein